LGTWVKNQRKFYSQLEMGNDYPGASTLTEEKMQRLNVEGFLWKLGNFRTWEERFEVCVHVADS